MGCHFRIFLPAVIWAGSKIGSVLAHCPFLERHLLPGGVPQQAWSMQLGHSVLAPLTLADVQAARFDLLCSYSVLTTQICNSHSRTFWETKQPTGERFCHAQIRQSARPGSIFPPASALKRIYFTWLRIYLKMLSYARWNEDVSTALGVEILPFNATLETSKNAL